MTTAPIQPAPTPAGDRADAADAAPAPAADDPGGHSPTNQPPHSPQRTPAAIDLDDRTARLTARRLAALRTHLAEALDHLRLAGELRVAIVADDAMTRAHAEHLGDATTTDVITFDLADGAAARTRELDADLLLCLDEAARCADRAGRPVEHELLLYALHGVLHCTGHDDHHPADHRAMHALEDEVLSAIGVGPVFAGERPESPSDHRSRATR